MRLFRKLFAEKILRFYEGTNAGIRYISNAPLIGRCVKENTFAENSKARLFVGIMAQLFMVLWEFIKKFAYVFILIYIPYVLIGLECPLIKANQELTIIYMFVMLSVICGSLSNFLGKLLYKMATEFIFYFIILNIFGVSWFHSLMLCMLTICVRPIGEMFAIMSFDHFIWVYENRSVFNGTVMAVCVLLAYGVPFFVRRLSHNWLYAVHPFVVLVFFLAGAGAMYFLWWYKYYRKIVREAMHLKHES